MVLNDTKLITKSKQRVVTEHNNRETNHKNSLQYIPNRMSKWCNTFQSVSSKLQL